jgi:small subunit ribosomal protein S10
VQEFSSDIIRIIRLHISNVKKHYKKFTAMSSTKMRVRIFSFDHKCLEEAIKKLVQIVTKSGAKVVGPVPLKTKKRIFTLRRSTFVFAKHADKIMSKEHKRLIDIYNVNAEVVNALSTLSLPASVDITIETVNS